MNSFIKAGFRDVRDSPTFGFQEASKEGTGILGEKVHKEKSLIRGFM